jgi:hypothetical protein
MDARLQFDDIKPEILASFIKNGWITIYKNSDTQASAERGGIFCCLGNKNKVTEILDNHGWDIRMGHGRPGFVFYHENGQEMATYYRIDGDVVEPFLHYRCDFGNRPSYFEVSEEFRLYYNLFEEYINLHERNFIHTNDDSDDEIVIKISKNEIIAKLRFIKDYISARKMVFIIFFDYMRFSNKSLKELGWQERDETTKTTTSVLNHFVRDISSMPINGLITQSWIMGKVIVEGIPHYKPKLFGNQLDEDDGKYVEFIIGYNKDGQILSSTCDENALNNLFGKNPDAPLTLTPVYFSCDVLKKYYDNPHKYSVEDGQIKCNGFWSLQIDNSAPDYVVVFLGDLGKISYKEQLYWKHFNISEGKGYGAHINSHPFSHINSSFLYHLFYASHT